ncbi:hypothetical protein O1611_g2940 [Lasiodiplodia mahajangana]|uniref:Uncharacterized protein n=1 Tax=Lasiodiplodia mahajangana TaxID=1108764 RepID=A0ACC2JT54_9PEZI|nr:hypothetical protein O1611_g2940 [Lasiodiplodia mahajangana]
MQTTSFDLESGRTSVSDSVRHATGQEGGIPLHETPAHVNYPTHNLCKASIESLPENTPTQFLVEQPVVTDEQNPSQGTIELCQASIEGPKNDTESWEINASHRSYSHVESTGLRSTSSAGTSESSVYLTLAGLNNATWAFRHHKANILQPIHKRKTYTVPWIRFPWGRALKVQNESNPSKWRRPNEDSDFRINLAELQRMRLRKLQCKLVEHVGYMRKFDKEPPEWENDLDTYTKAIRDYDYMTTRCQLPRDPFLITGERNIDSFVIHRNIGDVLKLSEHSTSIPVDGPWETDTQPIGGTRNNTVRRGYKLQLKERIVIAAIAGAFLVAPMWLMVLHNTLYTCLISTTAFVTVFGLILAWSLDGAKEVMSGTAAYAAVLVVFVGLGHT